MYIEDKNTRNQFKAEITRLRENELVGLRKNPLFYFDWTKYRGDEVYKLCIEGSKEILGVMRVIDHPEEYYDYLEIDVIEISNDNQGKQNGMGCIGGSLLGFTAVISGKFGHEGFLGLVAKNEKASLFHSKYGFEYIGNIGVLGVRMMSATMNSIKLIEEYILKKSTNENK